MSCGTTLSSLIRPYTNSREKVSQQWWVVHWGRLDRTENQTPDITSIIERVNRSTESLACLKLSLNMCFMETQNTQELPTSCSIDEAEAIFCNSFWTRFDNVIRWRTSALSKHRSKTTRFCQIYSFKEAETISCLWWLSGHKRKPPTTFIRPKTKIFSTWLTKV